MLSELIEFKANEYADALNSKAIDCELDHRFMLEDFDWNTRKKFFRIQKVNAKNKAIAVHAFVDSEGRLYKVNNFNKPELPHAYDLSDYDSYMSLLRHCDPYGVYLYPLEGIQHLV